MKWREISLLVEGLSASQEGFYSMELVNWIHLAEDRDQWRSLLKTAMNLQVPQNTGNFFTS
jgi:hypothetical protein